MRGLAEDEDVCASETPGLVGVVEFVIDVHPEVEPELELELVPLPLPLLLTCALGLIGGRTDWPNHDSIKMNKMDEKRENATY